MKKSRITKLALSGAAVAALAATFSTSTYAWYVSNRQADVTGGYAATGSAGSDGSIQISWNSQTKKYSKSISFSDNNVVSNYTTAALQPVHYDNGFYSVAVSNNATIKGSEAGANDVLTFEVVIKSNQGDNQKTQVTPSIKMKNFGLGTVASGTASPAANQQVLVGAYKRAVSYDSGATYYTASTSNNVTTYTQATVADAATFAAGTYYVAVANGLPGKDLNDEFVVDAFKAMYVQQTVVRATPANNEVSYVNCDNANVKIATWSDTEPANANAHTYYTAVTGNTVSWGNSPVTAEGLSSFWIEEDDEVVVKYTIFLDGGDVDCFNSCVGQNFSFDLSFAGGEPTDID